MSGSTGRRMAIRMLCAAAVSTQAKPGGTYPERPIKLVVHTTAGSAADTLARVFANDMGARLGQPMVVRNVAGAGGELGAELVARAPADGYTLLAGASSVMIMLPALSRRKLRFNPDEDFVPIGRFGGALPFVLLVNAESEIQSVDELVALSNQRPEGLRFGSSGFGTNPHVLGELLAGLARAKMTHVPYPGPGPAQIDLLGRRIDLQFDTLLASLARIRDGRLRALMVTGPQRRVELPAVPSVVELGYPQMQMQGWVGLYAPTGIDSGIQWRLTQALSQALASSEVVSHLTPMGLTADALMGDALREMQRQRRTFWADFARSRQLMGD